LLVHRLQTDPQRLQRLGRYALALMDEAEQDVLRAYVVMVERPGLFLSQDHNPPRPVGEPLEHLVAPSPSSRRGNSILLVPSRLLARAGQGGSVPSYAGSEPAAGQRTRGVQRADQPAARRWDAMCRCPAD